MSPDSDTEALGGSLLFCPPHGVVRNKDESNACTYLVTSSNKGTHSAYSPFGFSQAEELLRWQTQPAPPPHPHPEWL